MNGKLFGAALAIVIVTMAAFALPSASGDSSDAREAELYAGSAFAYSPSGDWTDAKASGTALGAGMEWKDGTLSGSIDEPGTYRAVFERTGASCAITLNVLPSLAINESKISVQKGDSVIVSGAEEGALVFPVAVSGPDGTEVSADCDRGLFAFDADGGFVLARGIVDSDKGTYTLTVRASHDSGPLYAETSLEVNVRIISQAEASGLDAEGIASLGTRSGSATCVVSSSGTESIANPSYAAPTEPAVSGLKLYSDGRDVRITSSVTDATKLTYNWGDGIRTMIDVGSVLNGAQHTYAHGGTYSVIITADGPYSSGYAVAVFDTPNDAPKGFIGEHGWVFILFAVLAMLAVIAFYFTRDARMLYATIAFAVLAVVCLVLKLDFDTCSL